MAKREHWPSKWIFILAAVGSAAGLGNLWRFPYLAYEYGGGTFLFVLLLANLLVGIPLLAIEIGLGQKFQKGAPDAMGSIKKGFQFFGWFAALVAFVINAYYMVVIGWGVRYLWDSLTVAWGDKSSDYFLHTILQITDGPGSMGGLSLPVLGGFLIGWIIVYFCVWKGVESVSKVVKFSATLPFIILFLLILNTLTLTGAPEGLRIFFTPEWSAISKPDLWIAAFSQAFFSLSVGMAIMFAYGSFKNPKSEITKSIVFVAMGNFLVSIMSGIVVFGTIGYMAMKTGQPFADVFVGGPSLAFMVFPQAITLLPALNALVGFLFFLTVLSLGIDSAFSLIEAFATGFRDRLPKIPVKKVALGASLFCALFGLLYTTKAGLHYLDITDHFFINYGVVLAGLFEVIAIGWFFGPQKLRKYLNSVSDWKVGAFWDYIIKYFAPIFLSILLIVNIYQELQAPYEGYPVWSLVVLGVLPLVLVVVFSFVIDLIIVKKKSLLKRFL